MTQIILLLQLVLSLLVQAQTGTPAQKQLAMQVATSAVTLAIQYVTFPQVPTSTPVAENTAPQQPASPAPTTPTPTTPVVTTPTPAPAATYTLEIISPIAGKGLGRTYAHYDWATYNGINIPDSERPAGFVFPTESNEMTIGVILRDSNGKVVDNATVIVTATDSTQNKVLNGTGTVTNTSVAYYPFNYEFKTAGTHTITFTANGVSQSATVNVQ